MNYTMPENSEANVARLNALLSATLDATDNGMLVVDKEGKIILANRRFAEMWGISKETLASQDDKKALDSVLEQMRDPNEFLRKVQELYASDDEIFDTLEFKDGRIFERHSRPLHLESMKFARLWSFHDVSELKTQDSLLKLRNEELVKINSLMVGRELRMREMKEELDQLKAAQRGHQIDSSSE